MRNKKDTRAVELCRVVAEAKGLIRWNSLARTDVAINAVYVLHSRISAWFGVRVSNNQSIQKQIVVKIRYNGLAVDFGFWAGRIGLKSVHHIPAARHAQG